MEIIKYLEANDNKNILCQKLQQSYTKREFYSSKHIKQEERSQIIELEKEQLNPKLAEGNNKD